MCDIIKLEPCPFCNGRAAIISGVSCDKRFYKVFCKRCQIRTPPVFRKGEAIDKWNRRTGSKVK